MRGVETNKIELCPNAYLFIILFCITALFEAAFLSLAIPTWNAHNIVIYLGLIFVLQMVACLKAICIWCIYCYPIQSIVYISCVAITGLFTYLAIKVFVGLTTVFISATAISLNPAAIALIDALLSVVLLYGLKNWLKEILKNEPLLLTSQIRHHFLFNTLNTTVCRIEENPRRAQDNIERLTDLFRNVLSLNTYISLEEELASVRCYLEIEKYRLEERLKVSWFLDRNTNVAVRVPALILQPLVENAIYHGVETIAGGGTIAISLCTVESRLIIQVCNPVSNTEYSDLLRGNRIAQTNIERRLALVYGEDFSFRKEQGETQYRATINIPKGGLL